MRAIWFLAILCAVILSGGAHAAGEEAPHEKSARTLYLLHCSGCHGTEGYGDLRADVPPINGYVGAFLMDPEGRRYLATVGGMETSGLNDAEKAQVLNWMVTVFGGDVMPPEVVPFDGLEVTHLRRSQSEGTVVLRREIALRLEAEGITIPEYPWP